jgi:hypothetical protein
MGIVPLTDPFLRPLDPATSVGVLAVAAYLSPSMIALARRHQHPGKLIAANLLLGWTLVGWTICLTLSLKPAPASAGPRAARHALRPPDRAPATRNRVDLR